LHLAGNYRSLAAHSLASLVRTLLGMTIRGECQQNQMNSRKKGRQIHEPRTRSDNRETGQGRVEDEARLAAQYREMAQDSESEREAHEWCESLIGDMLDDV